MFPVDESIRLKVKFLLIIVLLWFVNSKEKFELRITTDVL